MRENVRLKRYSMLENAFFDRELESPVSLLSCCFAVVTDRPFHNCHGRFTN